VVRCLDHWYMILPPAHRHEESTIGLANIPQMSLGPGMSLNFRVLGSSAGSKAIPSIPGIVACLPGVHSHCQPVNKLYSTGVEPDDCGCP
jgi:hypothetical protein